MKDCIKNKWVIKIKSNSVYQLHLVVCGYSQVPGVDFSKKYSQVFNNITFHILLLMELHFSCLAKIVDVEAFLYRDLEEETYMGCPQGMSNVGKNDCIM